MSLQQTRPVLEFVANHGPSSLYGLASDLRRPSETIEDAFDRVADHIYWLLALGLLAKRLEQTSDGTEVIVEATKVGKDLIRIEKATE